MIFNFDEEEIIHSIFNAFEESEKIISDEQFLKIAEAIELSMPGLIGLMTKEIAENWKQSALEAEGWGSKYAGAIQYKIDETTGEIFLDESIIDKKSNKPNSMFAKMMEEGVKSWSIKDALMKSKKVKISSTGIKYIIVPFPVATPRKESQGTMASQFNKREMSGELHQILKSGGKAPTTKDMPGISRYVTKQHHEQYGTFRVVTQNSEGWMYPNIPPEPVFPSVLQEANRRVNEIITEFIKAIIKEYSA